MGKSAEPSQDVVEARDKSGALMFRYDPRERRAEMLLPGAGLKIRCVDGVLELEASKGLRLRTDGVLVVEAREGIEIDGRKIDARLESATLKAGTVSVRAQLGRMAWGKLELSVGRLFEWASVVYRRVDGLLHTRAGRIRSQCKGAVNLQADTVRVQATNEVRIDGSSVNLG